MLVSRRNFLKICNIATATAILSPKMVISWPFEFLPSPEEILRNPLGAYVANNEETQLKVIDNLLCYMLSDLKDKCNQEDTISSVEYVIRNKPLVGCLFFNGVIMSKTDWRKYLIRVAPRIESNREWKDSLKLLEEHNPETVTKFESIKARKFRYKEVL